MNTRKSWDIVFKIIFPILFVFMFFAVSYYTFIGEIGIVGAIVAYLILGVVAVSYKKLIYNKKD